MQEIYKTKQLDGEGNKYSQLFCGHSFHQKEYCWGFSFLEVVPLRMQIADPLSPATVSTKDILVPPKMDRNKLYDKRRADD